MGIDVHAFNFIKLQANRRPLGRVLTVGRQSMSAGSKFTGVPSAALASGYCEPVLMALNAKSVESLDCSDYEGATYIADLNESVSIDVKFDTVIDSGSFEHIFDVATAFRNVIRLCEIGGRIIHILPVNNLNGHGFWQFSSDLLYTTYSPVNGFSDTEVFYASSLDFSSWYRVPKVEAGGRIEIVSLEPVILLCVTRKICDVESLSVMQQFYLPAWDSEKNANKAEPNNRRARQMVKRISHGRSGVLLALRNVHLILGLAIGSSRYSLNNSRFQKIKVDRMIRPQST